MKVFIAVFMLTIALAWPAQATTPGDPSGSAMQTAELLAMCKGTQGISAKIQDMNLMRCVGFFDGVISTYFFLTSDQMAAHRAGRFFCIPSDQISIKQFMAIFEAWTKANPDHLNSSAVLSALIALKEAYPCTD